ncbi:DUF2244 domain-containing protein [bacterium]|nr:DUF2244 domain-containing protein [bacterium]
MLELLNPERGTAIVLMPNSSMTWETNRLILLGMFVVNMTIGIGFALMGEWLILPFAGLEILLVGFGMYYVCWKLNFKQMITIEAESFTLQKGVYFPKEEWQWQTSSIELLKQPSRYRMSAPNLYLKHMSQTVEIGDFLNREEKKELVEWFTEQRIPVVKI